MSYLNSIFSRTGRKISRTARRVISVAVKKAPLGDDEFSQVMSCLRRTAGGFSIDGSRPTTRVITASDYDRIQHLTKSSYQATIDRVITRADDTLANEFRILGFAPHKFTSKIEWSRDFVSGYEWKNDYYLSVPIVVWDNESDIKIPWELSRGHYLVWLAQAWFFTGKSEYASKFVELVDDWIESNPYPYGPNWTCGMEVAIRLVNWVAALEILGDSDEIPDEFEQRILKQIYQHALFIEENLETIGHGLNTNHYLADLLGLLVAGHVFRDTPKGLFWRRLAIDELEKELFFQTLDDGFCFESSMNYHMLTAEMYLIAFIVESRRDGFSDKFRNSLCDMFRVMNSMKKPDGSLPNFGDGDSGRILVFDGDDRQNASELLRLGSMTLDLTDCADASPRPPYNSIWLEGASVHETCMSQLRSPGQNIESCCLRHSGLVAMKSDDHYLFLAANPVGTAGMGTHKHNDMLSVELSVGNTDFIVDSGTLSYTANPKVRNRFRSTAYHSTPSILGVEQNRFISRLLFALRPDAEVRIERWESNDRYDLVEAEHSGYIRLDNPVLVLRSVYFDKSEKFWLFRDSFYGSGNHDYINTLILGPVEPIIKTDKSISLRSASDSSSLEIVNLSEGWKFKLSSHEIAPRYGQLVETKRIDFYQSGPAPVSMKWAAFPNAENQAVDQKVEIARNAMARLGWKDRRDGENHLKLRIVKGRRKSKAN